MSKACSLHRSQHPGLPLANRMANSGGPHQRFVGVNSTGGCENSMDLDGYIITLLHYYTYIIIFSSWFFFWCGGGGGGRERFTGVRQNNSSRRRRANDG